MKKFIKLNPFTISAITVVVGIFIYAYGIPFLDLMELKTIDLRFQARGTRTPNPEILLAVIDEKSLEEQGKWVWPRSKIAALVTKLSHAGAKVVGLDVGFLEPDDARLVHTIRAIEQEAQKLRSNNKAFDHFLENLKRQSDNDRLLADAITNSKARVVLGYFFHMNLSDAARVNPDKLKIHQENIKGSRYKGA